MTQRRGRLSTRFTAKGRKLFASEVAAVEALSVKYGANAPQQPEPSVDDIHQARLRSRHEALAAVTAVQVGQTPAPVSAPPPEAPAPSVAQWPFPSASLYQAHPRTLRTVVQRIEDFELPPLLPLSAFAEAQLAITWKPAQPPTTLYLRDTERVSIQVEKSSGSLGYHLWRDEELGKQGICAHEEDSRAFAEGLVSAIAPRLSIFDLQFVVQAFTAELERAEAERQAAIAEHMPRQANPQNKG